MNRILISISALFLLALSSQSSYGQYFKGRSIVGEKAAREQVQQAIQNNVQTLPTRVLLKTSAAAIAVAEPILFSIYGKPSIVRQRPYEVYSIDGYWYISGTLPSNWDGGVFEIIIKAGNCQVIEVTHGK